MKILSAVIATALGVAAFAGSTAGYAALIVNPVETGPFSLANPDGSVAAINVWNGNTYDFTFSLTDISDYVLMQMSAAAFTNMGGVPSGMPEKVQFQLYSGLPGAGTLIGTSPFEVGPALVAPVKDGAYFIQLSDIAVNGELVDGSLQISAIPEPASWALMLLGIGGLGATMRWRRDQLVAA